MAAFVLDCSVAMAWCFDDEVTAYSESVLDSLGELTACVPIIWPLEVINVLLVAIRKKRLSKVKAASFIDRLTDLPIELANGKPLATMHSIFELGHKKSLSSYDTSYLDLALARDIPLATLDKGLAKTAKQVGIKIY